MDRTSITSRLRRLPREIAMNPAMKLTDLVFDDERRRLLEKKARIDAELGEYSEPHRVVEGTYQRQAILSAENALYALTFNTRMNRIKRK